MRSVSEVGSYLRLVDICITSTLGWRVMTKKKRNPDPSSVVFNVEVRCPPDLKERSLGLDYGLAGKTRPKP